MKHRPDLTHQPAVRHFRHMNDALLRTLMRQKLSENQEEQLKTLEPGARVDYLVVRHNAELAAAIGAELIIRQLFDPQQST